MVWDLFDVDKSINLKFYYSWIKIVLKFFWKIKNLKVLAWFEFMIYLFGVLIYVIWNVCLKVVWFRLWW